MTYQCLPALVAIKHLTSRHAPQVPHEGLDGHVGQQAPPHIRALQGIGLSLCSMKINRLSKESTKININTVCV